MQFIIAQPNNYPPQQKSFDPKAAETKWSRNKNEESTLLVLNPWSKYKMKGCKNK